MTKEWEKIDKKLSNLNFYDGVEYLRKEGFLPIFFAEKNRFSVTLDIAVSSDYKITVQYYFENIDPIDFKQVAPNGEGDKFWIVKEEDCLKYNPKDIDNVADVFDSYIDDVTEEGKIIWGYTWERFYFELHKMQCFGWVDTNYVYTRAMQTIYNNVKGKTLQDSEKIINELLKKDVYLKKIQPYMDFKVTSYANKEFHSNIIMDVNCYVLSAGIKHYNEDYKYRNVLMFAGETKGTKEHNVVVNGKWKYTDMPFFL